MFDRTMPDVHLEMRLPRLADVPDTPPPEGFSIRTYRPGEEAAWAAIETAAGEFSDPADALRAFEVHFGADRALLPERMFFAVDREDRPVATASAWFRGETGMLHWVAVHGDCQGQGLARPVISAALRRLESMGYKEVELGTQPPSWLAIRLYLKYGFVPVWKDDAAVIAGWEAVYRKIGKEFARELCVRSV